MSGSSSQPLKRSPIDFVAQKVTELGADVLWPVINPSYRSAPRQPAAPAQQHRRGGGTVRPGSPFRKVREPTALADVLGQWPDGPRAVLLRRDRGRNAGASRLCRRSRPAGRVAGSGRRGGFARDELDAVGQSCGCLPRQPGAPHPARRHRRPGGTRVLAGARRFLGRRSRGSRNTRSPVPDRTRPETRDHLQRPNACHDPLSEAGAPIESRTQLVEDLESGCTRPGGLAHRHRGTRSSPSAWPDTRRVAYDGPDGIGAILAGLTRFGWEPVRERDATIALTQGGCGDHAGTRRGSSSCREHRSRISTRPATRCERAPDPGAPGVCGELGNRHARGLGFDPVWRRDEVPWDAEGAATPSCAAGCRRRARSAST